MKNIKFIHSILFSCWISSLALAETDKENLQAIQSQAEQRSAYHQGVLGELYRRGELGSALYKIKGVKLVKG